MRTSTRGLRQKGRVTGLISRPRRAQRVSHTGGGQTQHIETHSLEREGGGKFGGRARKAAVPATSLLTLLTKLPAGRETRYPRARKTKPASGNHPTGLARRNETPTALITTRDYGRLRLRPPSAAPERLLLATSESDPQ